MSQDWRRPPPPDEHEIDPKDLYYLPDGVYRAVRRTAVVIDKQVQDGPRTVTVGKRIATAVQVVKVGAKVQDSGWRRDGRPPWKSNRKERR